MMTKRFFAHCKIWVGDLTGDQELIDEGKKDWNRIAKCLRSKKWGQYRYSGGILEAWYRKSFTTNATWNKVYVVDRKYFPDEYILLGGSREEYTSCRNPTEKQIIKDVNTRRYQEICLWVASKRKQAKYNKRKWKYIP